MSRPALLFSLFLIGCSGAGATVSDSSSADIAASREATPVEAPSPVDPVAPSVKTTTFECKTSEALSDGSTHTIRFVLRGDALEPEIAIEPPLTALDALTKATLERKNGKLVLVAADKTELGLFENSDLTRGYVKADGDYSDLYCTKR